VGNDEGSEPVTAGPLADLASIYSSEGRYAEAEIVNRRVLARYQAARGPDDPKFASILNNLANVLSAQGRHGEAMELVKQALAINERNLGPDDLRVGINLASLAHAYAAQDRDGDADPLLKRAIAILERTIGSNHPDLASALRDLAALDRRRGRDSEAGRLLKRALAIYERSLGADSLVAADALGELADLDRDRGRVGDALDRARRAAAIYAATAARNRAAPWFGGTTGASGDRTGFLRLLGLLAADRRASADPTGKTTEEAFRAAQLAGETETGRAVSAMTTRLAAGTDALAVLVREYQDLQQRWRALDEARVRAVSASPNQPQLQASNVELRSELSAVESILSAADARLRAEFSRFAAFAYAEPLSVRETQTLLQGDEALVFLLLGAKESHVFALTHDGLDWKVIPLGADAVVEKVAAFRRGLDLNEINKSVDEFRKPELFDLGIANELYATLLGPLEPLIKEKEKLVIVPSGALTALPFHLLVTEKPANFRPNDLSGYRDAAWLTKRQAVSVLPAVASLRALRAFAGRGVAGKPLIGFGDPIFDPAERQAALARRARTSTAGEKNSVAIAANTRAYTDFWHGAGVDRTKLAEALPLAA